MSIVAGTRAPIEAVKYFREAAKPKQVFPPDPPMRMPSTSVAMLRRRAKAELAQQGGFPPSETNVDANLLEQREGELIARRRANQRVNFEAYDAHKANIEALLSAQHGYSAQKDVLQYLAEHAQAEHTLGTAHAELRPARREDIANRIAQIRDDCFLLARGASGRRPCDGAEVSLWAKRGPPWQSAQPPQPLTRGTSLREHDFVSKRKCTG